MAPYLSEPMMGCELAPCLCETEASQIEQGDDCVVFSLLWTISGTWVPFSMHSIPGKNLEPIDQLPSV